jgi:preprotein translocase subunit SecE
MTDELKAQEPGTADKVKLTVAVLIALAGVAAYYVLAAQPAWLRWLAVVVSLVLGALVALFSRYGSEFRRFVELARIELRKIVWPTRDDTLKVTLTVFVFVTVAGVFFWVLDLALAWATKALTGQGG